VVVIICFAYLLIKLKWTDYISKIFKSRKNAINQDLQIARHFYGQMLRILAKDHHFRKRYQTPKEFLQTLITCDHPMIDDIEFITNRFCDVRYGESKLTEDIRQRITSSIDKLRQAKRNT